MCVSVNLHALSACIGEKKALRYLGISDKTSCESMHSAQHRPTGTLEE